MQMSKTCSSWRKGGFYRAPASCPSGARPDSSRCPLDPQQRVAGIGSHSIREIARWPVKRWTFPLLGAILLAFASGGFGYYLHAFRENTTSALSVRRIAALDYYVSWDSFSEVDEAKALLQASATQIIQELREQPGVGVFEVNAGSISQNQGNDLQLTQALRNLEQRIEEFNGTQQELLLVQELLWILWRESRYGQFMDVYLRAIYMHPTHDLVGHFADKALHISQRLGREQEMMKAFRHVTMIPLDFRAKRRVWSILEGINLVAQTAGPRNKSAL